MTNDNVTHETDAIDYTVPSGPRPCDLNEQSGHTYVTEIITIGRYRNHRSRGTTGVPWIEIRFHGTVRPSRYIAFESFEMAKRSLRHDGIIAARSQGTEIKSKYQTGTTWWLLPEHRVFGDGLSRHGFDIG